MKKWYFSKNGEISGPMDLASARTFVTKNADLYGWHPSFISWKPIGVIGEFSDLVNNNNSANQVPKEIINEFNNKKLALSEKLAIILDNIKETELLKAKLKKKISLYKHLTEDLNEEVQSAIVSIEQKYSAFSKRLLHLQDVATIATNEIEQITEEFKEQVSNKDVEIEVPAAKVRKISTTSDNNHAGNKNVAVTADKEDTDIDFDLVEETVCLIDQDETKENSANAKVTPKIKKISTETGTKKADEQAPAQKRIVIDTKAPDTYRQPMRINTQEYTDVRVESQAIQSETQEKSILTSQITSLENEAPNKKGLSGVKGIFKSVFKGNEPAAKLSSQSKMSDAIKESNEKAYHTSANDEIGQIVELKSAVNESEIVSDVDDSDETKKARRRRRRR
ncbi:DUF4339 domain-containing protein [Thalassotalea piscium]|uniref:GYF domain-containing protein n=1 Tax=Thalassotalea piscium TaxID=1230533 RepID=A0A7X0TUC2_9GAMM|nr:DUF4339 domain-containing protein [Thalassotalea piscium]MBB6543989.1 hypothetical protein [Thalassotalea piscium]